MSEASLSRSSRSQTTTGNGPALTDRLRSLFRPGLRRGEADWRNTIEELIEESEEPEQTVASHERTLLSNILRLKDLSAYDVMVPRADIIAVDVNTPLEEVLDLLAKRAHSRVPVYRDTLDEVVGMLHIKDVLAGLRGETPARLSELVRDVLIIAPSMPVLDLLLEMRQKRQHMALVVDEFGGIDGLITIEDLVEEIVGDIEDEHEIEESPQLIERPDGSYLADARLPLEQFEERLGRVVDEEEGDDIDTLGGLVFSLAGRIPARGELLRHPAGFEFEVVDADPRRIRRLRVRRIEPDETAAPDETKRG